LNKDMCLVFEIHGIHDILWVHLQKLDKVPGLLQILIQIVKSRPLL